MAVFSICSGWWFSLSALILNLFIFAAALGSSFLSVLGAVVFFALVAIFSICPLF